MSARLPVSLAAIVSACALVLVGPLAFAAPKAPPSLPSATSRPSSPPASKPVGKTADPLDDSDDDDDAWLKQKSATSQPVGTSGAATVAPTSISQRLRWRASALLRLATDFSHDSPRGGTAAARAAGFREDVLDVYGGAWATVAFKVSRRWRLQVGANLYLRATARRPEAADEAFYLFNGKLHRTDFEVLPAESYVELTLPWLDLRAGLLTTVWGVNDLVNPNDVLNPRDLRLGLLTEAEATRLATLGLKADVYRAGFHLSLLWQPIFVPHRIDVFGSDYALFGPGVPPQFSAIGALAEDLVDDSAAGSAQEVLLATKRPRPLVGSTLGVRLTRSWGGFDLALQYVWGYQRLPVLRLRKDLALALAPLFLRPDPTPSAAELAGLAGLLLGGGDLPLQQTFQRQHQVGASLSKGLWKLVLELDVSFSTARPEILSGGGVFDLPLLDAGGQWLTSAFDTKVLAYTLGARLVEGEEIMLKVEWWHELLLDVLTASTPPELLLGGGQRGGLAVLFNFLWRRLDLTGTFLAHAELFNGSLVFSPQLAYRVNQHLTILAGVNVFVGRRGPGALFDVNDQVYLALKGYL